MIVILIAILAIATISGLLLWYGSNDYKGSHFVATIAGMLGCMGSLVGLALYGSLVLTWNGAGHKANIINREYRTNYTQAEVFYASNVIDIILELNRKRVEINGDLMREYEDARQE